MKKILLIFMCIILLVSTVSAWGNVKSVSKTHDQWGYPEVTIKDSWNIPFLRSDLSKVKLEYHEPECLTDCYSKPHIEIYEDSAIIEDIRFIDGKGNLVERDYEIKLNGERYGINSVLAKGIYNPEIFVKKHINEKLDYQLKINGKWVDELAWWNTNWRYHRNITLTTTVDSENELIENINVTGLSLSTNNCDELRIVNSTGSEIPYNVTNSAGQAVGDGLEWCVIRITYEDLNVGSPLNYSAYYGNSGATKPSYSRRGGEHYDNSNVLQLMRLNDANAVKGENAGSSGVPTYVAGAGKFDNAMESDNNDDGLFWNPANFHDINATTGTVEFWYNYSNAGGDVYLWDNENPRIALYYSGGSFHYLTSVDNSVGVSLTNGQLYHLAFNWDMNLNVKRLYVDGAQVMNTSLGYSVATYENYTTGNMSLARRYTLEGGDYVSKWGRYDEMIVSNIFKTSFIGKNVTYIIGAQDEVTGVTATLNSPVDYYNSTSNDIAFNCSGNDNVGVLNITLIIDGVDNYTMTNSTPNSNLTLEQTLGISDGSHNWTCRASDGTGEQGDPNTASFRFFTVDTTPPNSNFTQLGTIDYHIAGNNLTINWTVNDTNLDTCIFEYAGVNKTVTCSANGTYINATSYSNRNVTLFANDSNGLANSTTMSWNYKIFQTGISYTANVVEGSTENFYLNFTQGASLQTSSVRLIYNSTSNLGTFSSSGNDITATKSIAIPNVAADINVTFNWNITMSDGSIINGTSFNQTISFLDIDNCSVYNKTLYNFTLYDEGANTKLVGGTQNTSGKVTIDIHSFDSSTLILNYSSFYNATNPFNVCLNNNLSSGSFNYLIDTQVQYGANGYETELYHIQNTTINSSSFPTLVDLYDLNSNDSQVFNLVFKDATFLPVEDALIQVQRKYIDDGIFRIVEIPKTDKSGKTVAHLVVNDVIYNFKIIKYGVVLATFNNVLASCQNPLVTECSIDFNAFSQSLPVVNYETAEDFNFTLGYAESTRTISSTFLIPSGSPATIILNVTKEDALGTSICTDTLTSSSGSLNCNVSTTFGNGTVIAKLYRDGVLQSQGQIKTGQSPSEIYGTVQVLLSLFIVLTLIGAGVSDNPIFTIIFLMISVLFLISLNLIASNGFIGSTATLLWIVVAIIIVLIKGGKRN